MSIILGIATIGLMLLPVAIKIYRKYKIKIFINDFEMTIPQILGTSLIVSMFAYILGRQYVRQVEYTVQKLRDIAVIPSSFNGIEFIIFIFATTVFTLMIITIPLYITDKIKIEPKINEKHT